jgi:hypothetical protein
MNQALYAHMNNKRKMKKKKKKTHYVQIQCVENICKLSKCSHCQKVLPLLNV